MRHERHDDRDIWQVDAPAPVGGLSLLHTDFPDRWELAVITADRHVVGQPVSLGDQEARDTLNAWEDGAGDAWFVAQAGKAVDAAVSAMVEARKAHGASVAALHRATEALREARGEV